MELSHCEFKRNDGILNTISQMNNIDKDKLLHFFWNYDSFNAFELHYLETLWGCVLLAFIGAAKEIVHDSIMKKGNCDFMDFVWGVLPIPIYFIHNLI